MPILVYLRDGRTLLLIAKRGFLGRLMKHEPDNEEGSISVKRAHWNPTTGEWVWQIEKVRLRYISKSSVSVTENASPADIEAAGGLA